MNIYIKKSRIYFHYIGIQRVSQLIMKFEHNLFQIK